MKPKAIHKKSEPPQVKNHAQLTSTPRVDIIETVHDYIMVADMPGVDQKNVDVKYENGVLNILGRVYSDDTKGLKKIYEEFQLGNYARAFEVESDVSVEKIQASMTNGVLRVTLPKREALKPKRIHVKSS